MTVLLGGGDIALGAIGTVTYVDGSTILGFGHPFLSAGRARFLLGDGYVFQTVAAPILNGSYKLAEPGVLRGMVTSDRADGIGGVIGPVEGIAAVGTAREAARGTTATVRGTIAPDPRTAPIVGGLVQDEPAARVLDGIEGGTVTLRVSISSPDLRRPVVYRNVYAAAGDVATLASGQVSRLLSILMQNGIRPVKVAQVAVDQTLQPRVRAARIVGARVSPAGPAPGRAPPCASSSSPGRPSGAPCASRSASRRGWSPAGPPCGSSRTPPRASTRCRRTSPRTSAPRAGRSPGALRWPRPSAAPPGRAARAWSACSRACAAPPTTATTRCGCWPPGRRPTTRGRQELAVPYVIYGGRATARIVVPAPGPAPALRRP